MKNRGDDATENVNFQRRKQRLQGPKIFQGCEMFKLNFDDFLMKDRGRCDRKCQFSKEETAFAGTQKFSVEF